MREVSGVLGRGLADRQEYVRRMARSMMDKLFWVDKVGEPHAVLDYGCADGTMLRHAAQWLPRETLLIGYDRNPDMIRNADTLKGRINFVSLLGEALTYARTEKHGLGRSVVVASSLLHEVYSYGSQTDITCFWDSIFSNGFGTIVIRDMVLPASADRPTSPRDLCMAYRRFQGTKELQDFETRWGSIRNNRNLIHFLMKYRYREPNWEREVRENYIPISLENMLALVPTDAYELIYMDHNVLPHTFLTVRSDTGITIRDPTHLKIILTAR